MRGLKSIVYILSVVVLCGTPGKMFAQSGGDKIEIRLNLLEGKNEKGVAEYALGVSIINHLNKDIYIPNFNLFASYSGVHFYQKEKDRWVEVSPETHDYVHLKSMINADGDSVLLEIPNGVYFAEPYGGHSLSQQFRAYTARLNNRQDSIVKAVYNSAADHHGLSVFEVKGGEQPLFLKANQVLDNFLVRNLDYLSNPKMDYKISFNTEARDSIKYYRDSLSYLNHLKKYGHLHYPAYIDNYGLFYPTEIISNVIYFTPDVIEYKR